MTPLTGTSQAEVLDQLCVHLAAKAQIPDPKKLLAAVQQRERSGTTFLSTGLAIPHARLPEVKDIHIVLGLHPQGLPVDFDDGEHPVHVICLFCSPIAGEFFTKHLQLLARIAAVFHDAGTMRAFAQSGDAQRAFTQLQQLERGASESTDRAHPPAA